MHPKTTFWTRAWAWRCPERNCLPPDTLATPRFRSSSATFPALVPAYTTLAPWFTPISIALPASWQAFKFSLQLLGQTRYLGTAGLMSGDFDELIAGREAIAAAFDKVATAQLLASIESDPERERSYLRVAEAAAATVSQAVRDLASRGYRSSAIRSEAQQAVSEAGPGVESGASLDEVGQAAHAVADHVLWCLENPEMLVLAESGLEDEAELEELMELARTNAPTWMACHKPCPGCTTNPSPDDPRVAAAVAAAERRRQEPSASLWHPPRQPREDASSVVAGEMALGRLRRLIR